MGSRSWMVPRKGLFSGYVMHILSFLIFLLLQYLAGPVYKHFLILSIQTCQSSCLQWRILFAENSFGSLSCYVLQMCVFISLFLILCYFGTKLLGLINLRVSFIRCPSFCFIASIVVGSI